MNNYKRPIFLIITGAILIFATTIFVKQLEPEFRPDPVFGPGKDKDVCAKGISSNNYKERVTLLCKCIEKTKSKNDPKKYLYFHKRGYAYEQLGQPELALNDYQKSIELNPQFPYSYLNSANIYYKNKKYNLALEFYTRSFEVNPKNAVVHYALGQTHNELKDYENAVKEYSKTIELNKNYVLAYLNRGYLFKRLGRFDWALADYDKALDIDPKNTHVLYNRSAVYDETGRTELALQDLHTILKYHPNHAKSYYAIGLVYHKQGQINDAVNNYKKAIKLKPEFTWSYNNLAEIYYSTNDPRYRNPEKAVDLLLKALEISGPRVPAYNQSLAAAYAQLGKFQNAVKYQEIAVDIAKERMKKNNGWEKILKEFQKELNAYKENKVIPIIQ